MSGNMLEFQWLQDQFTRHIRDPEHQPAPAEIEQRRMAIYRDLVYNNIESFMSDNFPVIREIMPDSRWHALIREFLINHRASTPLFPQLPTEFLQFLENRNDKKDFPFLSELAHYEWVESALFTDTREIDFSGIDEEGDLLSGIPVLNPLIMQLAYTWPVHKIGPEYLPEEAPEHPTFLVVYRDRRDEVGFMELNAVTAALLERISANTKQTGLMQLQSIATEIRHPQPEVVIQGGLEVIQQMKQRDIILGTKKT